jgi:hypothetical protein
LRQRRRREPGQARQQRGKPEEEAFHAFVSEEVVADAARSPHGVYESAFSRAPDADHNFIG